MRVAVDPGSPFRPEEFPVGGIDLFLERIDHLADIRIAGRDRRIHPEVDVRGGVAHPGDDRVRFVGVAVGDEEGSRGADRNRGGVFGDHPRDIVEASQPLGLFDQIAGGRIAQDQGLERLQRFRRNRIRKRENVAAGKRGFRRPAGCVDDR